MMAGDNELFIPPEILHRMCCGEKAAAERPRIGTAALAYRPRMEVRAD